MNEHGGDRVSFNNHGVGEEQWTEQGTGNIEEHWTEHNLKLNMLLFQ